MDLEYTSILKKTQVTDISDGVVGDLSTFRGDLKTTHPPVPS